MKYYVEYGSIAIEQIFKSFDTLRDAKLFVMQKINEGNFAKIVSRRYIRHITKAHNLQLADLLI